MGGLQILFLIADRFLIARDEGGDMQRAGMLACIAGIQYRRWDCRRLIFIVCIHKKLISLYKIRYPYLTPCAELLGCWGTFPVDNTAGFWTAPVACGLFWPFCMAGLTLDITFLVESGMYFDASP